MEMNKSTEVLDGPSQSHSKGSPKRQRFLAIFLCLIGIISLVVTIAILLMRETSARCHKEKTHKAKDLRAACPTSNVELRNLFKTIKDAYDGFNLKVELKNNDGVSKSYDKTMAPFNFTPEIYRHKTETAKLLLKNVEKFEERLAKGSITTNDEERHTFELFKYFLLNTFGDPYENNYEAGDWLMGPNIFCWQRSCRLIHEFANALQEFVPKNGKDIEKVIKLMEEYGEVFKQRIKNLKYGVAVGMVPSEEACRAGLSSFKLAHVRVAKHGAKGILLQNDVQRILKPEFLQNITQKDRKKWRQKYNVSIQKSFNESIVKHLGKPLNDLIRYLENDYLNHCPPSNVSSGLASLPLPYVYTNGSFDKKKATNGSLPGGEELSGKSSYEILLSYFTTYDVTPKEIDELADKRLKELYPQVLQIAKEMTKEENETVIKKFQSMLANRKYYYMFGNETRNGSGPFQEHLQCINAETAQKYCPERWQAMNVWLKSARAIVSRLRTKTTSAFYFTGIKQNTPNCPVDIVFDFNPSRAYYSYSEGSKDCASLAKVNIPFFLDKLGPKYEEVTVLAHEAYPGHHLEVQGVREHFEFKCVKMGNWVSSKNYFAAFSEGWATYVEKHVADVDMKLYENDIMGKYGMLKHQILAALRAKVDVGLHYNGLKRDEAIALYEKYVWDSDDAIKKEITRLQSAPGQGTSYMVGEVKLSELRKNAEEKFGNKFDVHEFHYHLLAKGPLPMSFLDTKMQEYIRQSSSK